MSKPVFYDATGRRGRWVRGGAAALLIALVTIVALLGVAVTRARVHAPLRLIEDAGRPQPIPVSVKAGEKGPWLPEKAIARATQRLPVLGFYMPWDEPSRRSLEAHVAQLDWLVPGLASVAGPGHDFRYESDPELHRIVAREKRPPLLLPMVQNTREDGSWDGAGTAALLASRAARARFADQLTVMVAAERGSGVMLDLESLPATAHSDYLRFLRELRARFGARGWQVVIAAPVADPDWELKDYAAVTDRLVLMAYDEHWMGGDHGPIASQPWFARVVAKAVADAGPGKAIVALGNYAYD